VLIEKTCRKINIGKTKGATSNLMIPQCLAGSTPGSKIFLTIGHSTFNTAVVKIFLNQAQQIYQLTIAREIKTN
jgi:hypothetical protein